MLTLAFFPKGTLQLKLEASRVKTAKCVCMPCCAASATASCRAVVSAHAKQCTHPGTRWRTNTARLCRFNALTADCGRWPPALTGLLLTIMNKQSASGDC